MKPLGHGFSFNVMMDESWGSSLLNFFLGFFRIEGGFHMEIRVKEAKKDAQKM